MTEAPMTQEQIESALVQIAQNGAEQAAVVRDSLAALTKLVDHLSERIDRIEATR